MLTSQSWLILFHIKSSSGKVSFMSDFKKVKSINNKDQSILVFGKYFELHITILTLMESSGELLT